MTQNNKKKIATWEKVARDYYQILVPNRPSQDDCRNYGLLIAKALKNKKDAKIMIMGATPELRRVLYTYEALNGAEVFCVDLNPAMYKAMTTFLSRSDHYQEKYIKNSWLKTEFPDQYFDLIVGDEVICNLDDQLHLKLFQEMSRILKNGGIWIIRHNVYLPEDSKLTTRQILINLAEKIQEGEYCFQLAMNIMYLRMFYYGSATRKFKNTMASHLIVMRKEYAKSLKNHKYNKIIKELLGLFEQNLIPMAGDYKWYILSEKESEKELEKFFSLENKVYSSDHLFAKNGPIYVLKKK